MYLAPTSPLSFMSSEKVALEKMIGTATILVYLFPVINLLPTE